MQVNEQIIKLKSLKMSHLNELRFQMEQLCSEITILNIKSQLTLARLSPRSRVFSY